MRNVRWILLALTSFLFAQVPINNAINSQNVLNSALKQNVNLQSVKNSAQNSITSSQNAKISIQSSVTSSQSVEISAQNQILLAQNTINSAKNLDASSQNMENSLQSNANFEQNAGNSALEISNSHSNALNSQDLNNDLTQIMIKSLQEHSNSLISLKNTAQNPATSSQNAGNLVQNQVLLAQNTINSQQNQILLAQTTLNSAQNLGANSQSVENAVDKKDHIATAELIKGLLNDSIALYKENKADEAKGLADTVYFQHFEGMEGDISINLGRKAYKMERKFKNLSKMYKERQDLRRVQALVDSIIFDLDEVAPIIQTGHRLVAEKTDDGLSEAEVDKLYAQNQQKSANEAAALFALLESGNLASGGNSAANLSTNLGLNSDVNSNENLAQTPPPNPIPQGDGAFDAANSTGSSNISEQLQAAYGIDPKLQYLMDEISFKFSYAASEFKHGNKQSAKDTLTSALMDDYRNSQVEIVVNQHTSKGLNNRIQRGIRAVIVKIDDENLTEKTLRNDLEEVENLVADAFSQIPAEQIARIQVAGFDENAQKTTDFSKVADDIQIALNNILSDYNGFNQASINALQSVYLDIFEASGMENRVGAINSRIKLQIEALFSQGVAQIRASSPNDELKATFDELNSLVRSMVDEIQQSTPYSLFIWAFGIIIREGMEALIIVVAIVSYLVQSGNAKRIGIVYSSLLTGVVLSFATAFLVSWIFKNNAGQSREFIEGFCMLVAVALLFYVGFWLLSNAQNKKWASFIKKQTIEAISNNSAKTLWFTVFLAVYREGAETVLFYQALLFDAKTSTDYSAIFGGLGVGAVVIIVLYFLLKAGAIRIPVKQFFYITSYIIFYMVFVFTGKGLGELIEGKFIEPTFLPVRFDAITWLGLYPYYETLVPQLIVLIMLILGIFITHKITSKQGAK